MSHRIEGDDGLVLVGEPAWHGLGVVIPEAIDIRTGFRRAIPWVPELIPLTWGPNLVPDSKGIIRKQEGKPDKYLSTVTSDYKLVTHDMLLEMAEAAVQASPDVKLETVGSTHGNRRVFLLLKVGSYGVGLNRDDQTSTYLALLNSFDGTTSFRGFGTEVRIVCANTYTAALSAADGQRLGFAIRHKGELTHRLDQAKAALAAGRLQLAKLEEEARFLVDQPMTSAKLGAYYGRVASILYPAVATEKPADPKEGEAWERQRERAKRTVAEWMAEFNHERQALVAGTLYAAHEAVTYWSDHQRSRVREHAADRLFGRGAAIKFQARKLALELAK